MRLTFDFDDLPTDEEISIIIETVRVAKSAINDKVHLGVKGRGLSFSIDKDALDSCDAIGIDVVSEVVTALVMELQKEIELEKASEKSS
jgi:hypothetical protein